MDARTLAISKSNMKPILNRQVILDFVRKEKNKKGKGESVIQMAADIGRLEVLHALLDLVNGTN